MLREIYQVIVSVNMPKLLLRCRKERDFFLQSFLLSFGCCHKVLRQRLSRCCQRTTLLSVTTNFPFMVDPPPLPSGRNLQVHIHRSSAVYPRCRKGASATEDGRDYNKWDMGNLHGIIRYDDIWSANSHHLITT